MIQGNPIFEGELLGGCIDSLYDMLTPYTHSDEPKVISKYEIFYDEYKNILIDVVDNDSLPILFNVNFGHATPRCILPFGIKVRVDFNKQEIEFLESPFAN